MYADAAYCYRRSSVVCSSMSVTIVSPARRLNRSRVGPRNYICIRWGPDPQREETSLTVPIVKYREYRRCAAAMRPFVKLLWPLVMIAVIAAILFWRCLVCLSTDRERARRWWDRHAVVTVPIHSSSSTAVGVAAVAVRQPRRRWNVEATTSLSADGRRVRQRVTARRRRAADVERRVPSSCRAKCDRHHGWWWWWWLSADRRLQSAVQSTCTARQARRPTLHLTGHGNLPLSIREIYYLR